MNSKLRTILLIIYLIFQILLLIYLAFNFILLCYALWLLYGLGVEFLYQNHLIIKMLIIYGFIIFGYIFCYYLIYRSAKVTKKMTNNIPLLKSEKVVLYLAAILIIANIVFAIILFPFSKILFDYGM